MSLIPRHSFFDFDNFYDNFFAPHVHNPSDSVFMPRVDIVEKDNHYEIKADLPGVKKEDIHIQLHNGVLSLDAKMESENSEEQDGKVIRRERRAGSFTRTFSLGAAVQESDISASLVDGVLIIKAPKFTESSSEQRKIEIN